MPIRVLALRLPPDQAEQAQARLQKNAHRQGRRLRESTLRLACWVILLSTLPAWYSASELFWLYRCRWQIERLIKAMKQLLPLVQLRCEKPEMIRVTRLSWALAWVWQEAGVQDIVQQLQRSCETPQQLQEEFRQVQQQWEQEEARLAKAQSANAQPEAVADLPETPTHLLFPQPAPCAPSRWVISCCSIQWLQSVVQGQWGWHHLLASLPRLVRFFCPSPRRRRSQWFQLEAWVRLRFAHSAGLSSLTNSSFP